MKNKLKQTIKLFIITTFFASCGSDFVDQSQLPQYRDKLVINGEVSNLKGVSVRLSNSASAYTRDTANFLRNGIVTLSTSSGSFNVPFNPATFAYELKVNLAPGTLFELSAENPIYAKVRAQGAMPLAPNFVSERVINGGKDSSGQLSDLLKITFSDPADKKNFYRLNFFYYNETLASFTPFLFDLTDPALASYNTTKLNDGSILFSDALLNGQSKTFSVIPTYGYVIGNTTFDYLIQFESVTEDFYKYFISLQRARDARNAGFTNSFNSAVILHSNVAGGLGIFGGVISKADTIVSQ